jgi:hypothetical protein
MDYPYIPMPQRNPPAAKAPRRRKGVARSSGHQRYA